MSANKQPNKAAEAMLQDYTTLALVMALGQLERAGAWWERQKEIRAELRSRKAGSR